MIYSSVKLGADRLNFFGGGVSAIISPLLNKADTVDMVWYGAPEGTRKLKSFEWLDCTNNKVLNVAIAQTIKFRMSPLHKQ